jgi:hypothetical protein
MPGRVGLPGPRRPRRSDIAAGAVVLLLVLSICVVGTGLFIENKLQPSDGRFGLPRMLTFPLCGASYHLSVGGQAPKPSAGDGSFIVEPTIGQIPLVELFTRCPRWGAAGFRYTVIYLHDGPDSYSVYELEGGP